MKNAHVAGKNLIVNSSLILDPTQLTPVEQALFLAQEYLGNFASEPDFGQKMAIAFGEGAKVDSLRTAWSANDFSDFPDIEIRDAADINGANGAFAAATNKIYLSQEFIINHQGNVGAIARVLLEEFGHFVDSRINVNDTAGDEGQIFSELVWNKTITPEQLEIIRSEDDTSLIILDGQTIQIEQAVADQVLWSQRIGTSLGGNWEFGKLLGRVDNEKSFNTKDIFGSSLVKNDVLGVDTSFRKFSDLPIPGIDLGVVGANADLSLGIANSKDKSKPATLKAGLQINAGYNLGGVNWNIPMFADASLGINNSKLNFQLNRDQKGAFVDYISPYLFLNVAGVIQSNAAAYINGSFNAEYVDIIESFFSFKKKVNTKSMIQIYIHLRTVMFDYLQGKMY